MKITLIKVSFLNVRNGSIRSTLLTPTKTMMRCSRPHKYFTYLLPPVPLDSLSTSHSAVSSSRLPRHDPSNWPNYRLAVSQLGSLYTSHSSSRHSSSIAKNAYRSKDACAKITVSQESIDNFALSVFLFPWATHYFVFFYCCLMDAWNLSHAPSPITIPSFPWL